MSISEIHISKNGITGSKDTHCISNLDFSFKLETHISKQVPMDASKMVIWVFPGKCLQTLNLVSPVPVSLFPPFYPATLPSKLLALVSITQTSCHPRATP